jgi:hypothetical protein
MDTPAELSLELDMEGESSSKSSETIKDKLVNIGTLSRHTAQPSRNKTGAVLLTPPAGNGGQSYFVC